MDADDLILVSRIFSFDPFVHIAKDRATAGALRPGGRRGPRLSLFGAAQERQFRDRQRAEPCFGPPRELRSRQ
jgi:hypothetical protein